MVINFFGQTSIRIQGNGSSLLFNPVESSSGLKPTRQQNDVVIYSQKPTDKVKKDNTFVIDSPGEYEIKGVFIYGLPVDSDETNIIYIIEYEGIRLAHLGLTKQTKFTEKQLERLQGIDILVVPVGGGEALEAKQAAEIINQLEPRVVIPVNYQLSGLKDKVESVDKFKKEIGGSFEKLDKLKIAKKDLPEEEARFVILDLS